MLIPVFLIWRLIMNNEILYKGSVRSFNHTSSLTDCVDFIDLSQDYLALCSPHRRSFPETAFSYRLLILVHEPLLPGYL